MQSKGKLGSIVAGVIAIFLVLVCLFYLSFTFVSNNHETAAENYATKISGPNGTDSVYNQAYKHYMDSLSEKPVYMGYTLNEVRKWGVGLGLDLKGGMNVILQVDMPDMLRSMSASGADSVFERALAATNALVRSNQADDYVGTFVQEYRRIDPNADFSTIFTDIKPGTDASNVASVLKLSLIHI